MRPNLLLVERLLELYLILFVVSVNVGEGVEQVNACSIMPVYLKKLFLFLRILK